MIWITRSLDKSQTNSAPFRMNGVAPMHDRHIWNVYGPGGTDMHQWVGIGQAADRARWLGQVSAALDDAQCALYRLGIVTANSPSAIELFLRIEEARLQVQQLQRRATGQGTAKARPIWTEPSPWTVRP